MPRRSQSQRRSQKLEPYRCGGQYSRCLIGPLRCFVSALEHSCVGSKWRSTNNGGQSSKLFGKRFYQSQPEHELFMCSQPKPWDRCVPYYVHGDEGRGLRNRPLMVEAFQVAIGAKRCQLYKRSGELGIMI